MDIYATPEQVMLDERALSERLGVSRTLFAKPSVLEQDGFVKTVPRRASSWSAAPRPRSSTYPRLGCARKHGARLITTTRAKRTSRAAHFFKILARIACRRIMSRNTPRQYRVPSGADLASNRRCWST